MFWSHFRTKSIAYERLKCLILTEVHKANYLPKIYHKNLLSSSQNDRLVNCYF